VEQRGERRDAEDVTPGHASRGGQTVTASAQSASAGLV
jgi:hypothetical protein